MDLILWRHCEAEPGEPDLGRRLTSKGLKQAERMAAWLDTHLPDTCRVLVSPADRAQQTAQALQRKFRTVPELAPTEYSVKVTGSTGSAGRTVTVTPGATTPVVFVLPKALSPAPGEVGFESRWPRTSINSFG